MNLIAAEIRAYLELLQRLIRGRIEMPKVVGIQQEDLTFLATGDDGPAARHEQASGGAKVDIAVLQCLVIVGNEVIDDGAGGGIDAKHRFAVLACGGIYRAVADGTEDVAARVDAGTVAGLPEPAVRSGSRMI